MSEDPFDLAIIVPASNEEHFIAGCIESVLRQNFGAGRVQIIVASNACTDRTEAIVENLMPMASLRGWTLTLQSDAEPGKISALNRADHLVRAPMRLYLDADVVLMDRHLLEALRHALDRPQPTYATARLLVTPATSWITRAYAAFWCRLPFVTSGTVGAGLFAVNAAGRERWGEFPAIISDDTFVRLNFSPDERVEVSARYLWPMVEGLRNLVRVRRRQDEGVREVYRHYPNLRGNEAKPSVGSSELIRLFFSAPIGFAVYALVQTIVACQRPGTGWSRGR